MKLSNDFWFNYPIFLPDYEQFNQVDPQFQLPPGDAAPDQNGMLSNQIRPPQ